MLQQSIIKPTAAVRLSSSSRARSVAKPSRFIVRAEQDPIKGVQEAGQQAEQKIDAVGREVSDATQTVAQYSIKDAQAPSGGSKPSIFEAMAFAGPIPERANSRLAMIGILAALGAEKATGLGLADQIKTAPVAIGATFALLIAASLIPVLKKGSSVNNQASGPFTPKAELYNGRLAMLAFLAVVGIEAIKGSAIL
jgi:hypothetical protein